jgi:hypothetical protein
MDIRIPISPQSTRFLDRLRNFIRLRGLAYKTEQTPAQFCYQTA